MAELSPMMRQYFEIKEKNKDAIVFFRLGDFYEMFYEDAQLASKELELTLTGRDCGNKEKAPMCGVPYHSCESYIARLVEKGYKIAICEQVSEPSSKGIVKRDVTRVITPGTIIESELLDESKNNFICSLFEEGNHIGLCFCDVSTGELHVTEITGVEIVRKIKDELVRFSPREILFIGNIEKLRNLQGFIKERLSCFVEIVNPVSDIDTCKHVIKEQFEKRDINDLGLFGKDEIIMSLAALINYLKKTQKVGLERINTIDIYSQNQFMKIDMNTRRNLELTETMRNKSKQGSLLWVLDKTKTAMGKRLMRTYIEQPLMNVYDIEKRLEAVEELYSNIMFVDSINEDLTEIYDIERLMTRIVYGSANARELRALCGAFAKFPILKSKLKNVKSSILKNIEFSIDEMSDIKKMIDEAIVDDPPFSLKEGGIIRPGYNKEIDLLRGDLMSGKDVISEIESREKKRTGITKLKVGYNRVFGYFIEVSNSFKNKVPDDYIRKQTLANCERYITGELKELEGRILGAKERSMQLEYEIFVSIRKRVSNSLKRVQSTAKAIAELDVLQSLASVAYKNGYVRPKITTTGKIDIKESRHPVVEKLMSDSLFVPNDVYLDGDENKVAIITGPNMAGKSTYMRQVALITLMAQIGSFVPAKSADIGIVDSIFTRVGASDDLASGQSTFMIEMMEVAQIIKCATKKSLVILDEIGRGTSTFDGMSIARAVVEYVADDKKLGAKTLFATHYHELTELEDLLDGVKNYNIAVKKRGDDIIFLRRIVRGGADDSYGIEVAKLAGVPESIISRAKEVLRAIDSGVVPNISVNGNINKSNNCKDEQITFEQRLSDQIVKKIKDIDVTALTPIEAMNILFELTKLLNR